MTSQQSKQQPSYSKSKSVESKVKMSLSSNNSTNPIPSAASMYSQLNKQGLEREKSLSNSKTNSNRSSPFSTLTSGSVDDSVLMNTDSLNSIPLEVELYENQRNYPIVGWSKNLLPTDPPSYSNLDGSKARNFTDFKNPPGFIWNSEWISEKIPDSTDAEGWTYFEEFSDEFPGEKAKKSTHSVRRRKFVRTRKLNQKMKITQKDSSQTVQIMGNNKRNSTNNNTGEKLSLSQQLPTKTNSTSNNNPIPPPSAFKLIPKPVHPDPANLSPIYTTSSSSLSSILHKTPVKKQYKCLRCFEFERYYPIVGWSEKLLPTDRFSHWQDEKSNKINNKEEIQLSKEWKWCEQWNTVINSPTATDENGWSYAVDFEYKFHPSKSLEYFVRKREWMRKAEKIDLNTSESNKNKAIQTLFKQLEEFKKDLIAEQGNLSVISLNSLNFP